MNRYIDVNEWEKASKQSGSPEDLCLPEVVVDHDEEIGETLFENTALNSGLRMIVGNYVAPRTFDAQYCTFLSPFQRAIVGIDGPPRTFGTTAVWRF